MEALDCGELLNMAEFPWGEAKAKGFMGDCWGDGELNMDPLDTG